MSAILRWNLKMASTTAEEEGFIFCVETKIKRWRILRKAPSLEMRMP